MCNDPTCRSCRRDVEADELLKPYAEKLRQIGREIRADASFDLPMRGLVTMRSLVLVLAELAAEAPDGSQQIVLAKTFHALGDTFNKLVPPQLGVNVAQVNRPDFDDFDSNFEPFGRSPPRSIN